MSTYPSPITAEIDQRPVTVPRFVESKKKGRKLSVLTAYDFLWATLLDAAGVDAILVGDSLAMVVQGKKSTLPVTLDQMIYHGEMVARAARRALVIVDLPFMAFQVSVEETLRNAGRVIKETGASAVKLECGMGQMKMIQALADADIPVMAHVGLKPQSVLKMGGYRIQRDENKLLEDALAAEQAGAFSIVLECVPQAIAGTITRALSIPTIGIGAGPDCDGQVLVTPDMLALTPGQTPRFVRQFADLGTAARAAISEYIRDVQAGQYPTDAHSHQ